MELIWFDLQEAPYKFSASPAYVFPQGRLSVRVSVRISSVLLAMRSTAMENRSLKGRGAPDALVGTAMSLARKLSVKSTTRTRNASARTSITRSESMSPSTTAPTVDACLMVDLPVLLVQDVPSRRGTLWQSLVRLLPYEYNVHIFLLIFPLL